MEKGYLDNTRLCITWLILVRLIRINKKIVPYLSLFKGGICPKINFRADGLIIRIWKRLGILGLIVLKTQMNNGSRIYTEYINKYRWHEKKDMSCICTSFHIRSSASILHLWLCLISFFCCPPGLMFLKTLVHELHIFFTHTEWNLLSLLCDNSE